MLKYAMMIVAAGVLSACCCQEQGAPALRPLPDCTEQIQPVQIIPVQHVK